MADLKQRIESMYRSDVRGGSILVVLLWVTILFVLVMTWPHIPVKEVKVVVLVAAGAVLIFNTAAVIAMIAHYKEDKDFIYGLDIENLDAQRKRKTLI